MPDPTAETLSYRVPNGQDPAVLLVVLDDAGYDYASDLVGGDHVVTVRCPAGRERDRARIRALLEGVDKSSLEGPRLDPGPVVFEDEL